MNCGSSSLGWAVKTRGYSIIKIQFNHAFTPSDSKLQVNYLHCKKTCTRERKGRTWGQKKKSTVMEWLHVELFEALATAVSQLSLLSSSLVSVCRLHYIVCFLLPICSTGVAVGVNVLKSLPICLPQIHPTSSFGGRGGGSCAPLFFRFPVKLSSFCFPVKRLTYVSVRACNMYCECVLRCVCQQQ